MVNCTIPLYLQPNGESAGICSSRSGYMLSLFASIFTLIVFLGLRFVVGSIIYFNPASFQSGSLPSSSPGPAGEIQSEKLKKGQETYNNWLYGIFSLILILIWILIPIFSGSYGKIEWEGYQQEKNIYMKQGFTEKESLNKVADNFNAKKLRSTIRMNVNNRY